MKTRIGVPCLLFLVASLAGAQDFDLLLRGGRILDGSGNPDFRTDIAIRGDRIAAMGKLTGAQAARVVEATGLFIVPGFIDMHSHADRALASDDVDARKAHNRVAQGITTVVVGADGRNQRWPVREEMATHRNPGTALAGEVIDRNQTD